MPLAPHHLGGEFLATLGRDLGLGRAPSLRIAPLSSSQGVLSRVQPSRDGELVGHYLLTLTSPMGTRRLVLKAKAPGAAVRQRLESRYRAIDTQLAELGRAVSPSILDASHLRELDLAALPSPALRAHSPAIARVLRDDDEQIFALLMEHLSDVRHPDSLGDLDAWTEADLTAALGGLAAIHGAHLTSPQLLPFAELHNPSLLAYQGALLRYNADAFPERFSPPRRRLLERLLAAAPPRHRQIAARPLTLIHGDLSPRNLCLRPTSEGHRLCAYDWELAQRHLPARDVVELLAYTLPPRQSFGSPLAARLLERYRLALIVSTVIAAETSASPSPSPSPTPSPSPEAAAEAPRFAADVALALAEFATFKLLVQGITHQLLGQRAYFDRLVENTFAGLTAFAPFLEDCP